MESPAGCMESVAKRRHGITPWRVFPFGLIPCIFCENDSIQTFGLIPYRRQAADFIHAYRRDYIESYVEALEIKGFSCF